MNNTEKENQYLLSQIKQEDVESIQQFLGAHYVPAEPMCAHLGIQAHQFTQSFHKLILQTCSSGFSFKFTKNEKMVAIILAVPISIYFQPVKGCQKINTIEQIIQQIESFYQPKDSSKTLSVFIGCTVKQEAGKGLFSKLIQHTQKIGLEKGFRSFSTECTSGASQKPFKKLGYEQIARIWYDKFQSQGATPFKGIKNAESLVFMAKDYQL